MMVGAPDREAAMVGLSGGAFRVGSLELPGRLEQEDGLAGPGASHHGDRPNGDITERGMDQRPPAAAAETLEPVASQHVQRRELLLRPILVAAGVIEDDTPDRVTAMLPVIHKPRDDRQPMWLLTVSEVAA